MWIKPQIANIISKGVLHDDKMNYWCIFTERCRVAQEKLHWSPNPEGLCDFLGNRKLPITIYGMGGLRFTDFVIYCYTGTYGLSTPIWRALFRNALSAIPKYGLAMPMSNLTIMFSKRAFHIWINAYIYVQSYEELFSKSELGIAIITSIFGIALNVFWKRALDMCIWFLSWEVSKRLLN